MATYNFIFEDNYLVVYTDGACINNGKKDSKAGIGVFFNEDHLLNISEKLTDTRVTNNIAEIKAAIKALDIIINLKLYKKVILYTDSQYLINLITKWIFIWEKKGWRKADNKPIKNLELIQYLRTLTKQLEINWRYIEAHNNNYGNEQADRLARQAINS